MGINVFNDVVLQQFAASAKRFATGAEAVVAKYGDEALDGRKAFQPDIQELRRDMGALTYSYKLMVSNVPEAIGSLSDDLREQMTAAVRAAETTNAIWHNETGVSSVASFAALADAAQGVAEVTSSGAPMARPVRVVVGGGGPAGLATANLLREAGADVQLFAPVAQARNGSVMLDRRGWGVLERAGGAKIVAEAPVDHTGNYKMASLPWLERDMGERAGELGVQVDRRFEVQDAENIGDGVRVTLAHPGFPADDVHIDADWYVDATGGHSWISAGDTFRRDLFEGTFKALPTERTFIATSAKAIEDRGLGWTAADGTFAINDVREGVLTAYRGLDEVAKGRRVSAEEATELLRAIDVDPTTIIGKPWSFTAQQSLARSAGQGRILIVGDGAGTVMPVQQAGVFLALTDAERAAKTIIGSRNATREAIDEAVTAYDAQTRIARTDAVMGTDFEELLKRIATDAGDEATEATEQATHAHDEQTRMMHRLFLA